MQKTLLVLAALCASAAWGSTLDISKSCPGTGIPDVCDASGSITGFGTFHLILAADSGVNLQGPGSRSATATVSAIVTTSGPAREGVIRLDDQSTLAVNGHMSISIEGFGSCSGPEVGCRIGGTGNSYLFEVGVPFKVSVSAAASAFSNFNAPATGSADVRLAFSLYELGLSGSLYGGDPIMLFEQLDQQSPIPTPEPSSAAMIILAAVLIARKAGAFHQAR